MLSFIKRQPPVRLIAIGFLLVILLGSLLLKMPFSVRDGVELSYVDSLYTSTSAVCVTGLVVVDAYDTFTPIGQTILGLLMQVGGLGVTAVGAGVILLIGRKMDLKSRNLVREAMSLESGKGVVRFLRHVFLTTLIIELAGAILSFFVFIQDFPLPRAIGLSLFHSVAAFNNSGFDLLGGGQSLIPYRDNVFLNIVTCLLILLGGIGFLVIREMWTERMRWKRFSMHTKVVLSVTLLLTVAGTVLFYLTEEISWLGALFASVTTRTAGFSSYSYGSFSNAGILLMMVFMFIGASSGSTGGGIKTGTLFALFQGLKSAATNKSEKAFHYSLPKDSFRRAATIVLMALSVIMASSFVLMILEPHLPMRDILFEMTSAFGTVGLTTGITSQLSVASKFVSMLMMFIGRLGPLTIASLWYFSRGERVRYPEGNLTVG